jgi:hypothetical protein
MAAAMAIDKDRSPRQARLIRSDDAGTTFRYMLCGSASMASMALFLLANALFLSFGVVLISLDTLSRSTDFSILLAFWTSYDN